MAAAETARLVASLELKDNGFTRTVGRATGSLGRLSGSIARSRAVAVGLGIGLERVASSGISALGGAIQDGIASAQDLERAQAQTAAVIASTGGAAGVTAAQVRELAEAQESATTADDKAVQQGENLLLTFTNIGEKAFPQATKAMVDMAIAMNKGDAATADFDGSAIQLGKALNDPVKGITALSRVGVSFSKEQVKRIKGLVKEGKTYDAQRVILAELEKEFGKAGKAAGTGFTGDVNRAADSIEDAKVAIAQGLMPAVGEVARELTQTLGQEDVQRGLKDLGAGLGDAVKGAVDFARTVPWGTIASSLQSAAGFAKDLLNAFLGLPSWVQTAVITGWGLNKLTGGAVTGLIGNLASGLVKGVLGIKAGVVNVQAATVAGGGGVPGAGVAAGASKGARIASAIGKVAIVGEAIGLTLAVTQVRDEISAASTAQATAVQDQTTKFIATQPSKAALENALAGVDKGIADLQANPLLVLVQGEALDKLRGMKSDLEKQIAATKEPPPKPGPGLGTGRGVDDVEGRRGRMGDQLQRDLANVAKSADIETLRGKVADDLAATSADQVASSLEVRDEVQRAKEAVDTGSTSVSNAARAAGSQAALASANGASRVVAAINGLPVPQVNVYVTGASVEKTNTVVGRNGPIGGSRDDDLRDYKPGGG